MSSQTTKESPRTESLLMPMVRAAGRPWQDRAGERWGTAETRAGRNLRAHSQPLRRRRGKLGSACEGAPVESRMRGGPNPEDR